MPLSPDFTLLPLKYHSIFSGRSPLLTVQVTKTISWAFTVSSPNSNGDICGGTTGKGRNQQESIFEDVLKQNGIIEINTLATLKYR